MWGGASPSCISVWPDLPAPGKVLCALLRHSLTGNVEQYNETKSRIFNSCNGTGAAAEGKV